MKEILKKMMIAGFVLLTACKPSDGRITQTPSVQRQHRPRRLPS